MAGLQKGALWCARSRAFAPPRLPTTGIANWFLSSLQHRTDDDVELIDDDERLNLDDYELLEIDEDARPADDSGMFHRNFRKRVSIWLIVTCRWPTDDEAQPEESATAGMEEENEMDEDVVDNSAARFNAHTGMHKESWFLIRLRVADV